MFWVKHFSLQYASNSLLCVIFFLRLFRSHGASIRSFPVALSTATRPAFSAFAQRGALGFLMADAFGWLLGVGHEEALSFLPSFISRLRFFCILARSIHGRVSGGAQEDRKQDVYDPGTSERTRGLRHFSFFSRFHAVVSPAHGVHV